MIQSEFSWVNCCQERGRCMVFHEFLMGKVSSGTVEVEPKRRPFAPLLQARAEQWFAGL